MINMRFLLPKGEQAVSAIMISIMIILSPSMKNISVLSINYIMSNYIILLSDCQVIIIYLSSFAGSFVTAVSLRFLFFKESLGHYRI